MISHLFVRSILPHLLRVIISLSLINSLICIEFSVKKNIVGPFIIFCDAMVTPEAMHWITFKQLLNQHIRGHTQLLFLADS